MFCEKCGREIRNDSLFCSYCGVRVDTEELEQPAEPARQQSGTPSCIRPGAPKKKCLDCGKELPGSTVSDVCAMCTIRRRNRELDAQREINDVKSAERDRYDISDEFDFSVFHEDRGQYFHGEEDLEEEPRRTRKKHDPYANPNQRRKPAGCAPLIILLIFLAIGGGIALFNFAGSSSAELITAEVAPRREPELKNRPEDAIDVLPAQTEREFFEDCIASITQDELAQVLSDVISVRSDLSSLQSDGGFITLGGVVVYPVDGRPFSDSYTFTLMLTQTDDGQLYYLPLYLELAGNILSDNRTRITNDGFVTADGAQLYGVPEGTLLFDAPPIFWDDLLNA